MSTRTELFKNMHVLFEIIRRDVRELVRLSNLFLLDEIGHLLDEIGRRHLHGPCGLVFVVLQSRSIRVRTIGIITRSRTRVVNFFFARAIDIQGVLMKLFAVLRSIDVERHVIVFFERRFIVQRAEGIVAPDGASTERRRVRKNGRVRGAVARDVRRRRDLY